MNELPERIKRRLYKLLELANRGVAGERANAESRLDALLIKHGIEKSDFLEKNDVQEFFFTFNNKFEKRLFLQVTQSVGVSEVYSFRGTKRLAINSTVAQHAEVLIKYSVYRKALRDEFEMTFEAFIHSQEISQFANCDESEPPELSQEDQHRVELIAKRAMIMERVPVHKGVGSE